MPFKDERKRKQYMKKYAKKYNKLFKQYAQTEATNSNAGQAGELLVAADLLKRGLPTTKPLNVNGAHDLHVKCSGTWRTVQVKLGVVNSRTGTISQPGGGRNRITSDIKAFVDITTMRIRYLTNVDEPLPPELTE